MKSVFVSLLIFFGFFLKAQNGIFSLMPDSITIIEQKEYGSKSKITLLIAKEALVIDGKNWYFFSFHTDANKANFYREYLRMYHDTIFILSIVPNKEVGQEIIERPFLAFNKNYKTDSLLVFNFRREYNIKLVRIKKKFSKKRREYVFKFFPVNNFTHTGFIDEVSINKEKGVLYVKYYDGEALLTYPVVADVRHP